MSRHTQDEGAVVVWVAVTMFLIFAMAMFLIFAMAMVSIDAANAFHAKAEIQTATDASVVRAGASLPHATQAERDAAEAQAFDLAQENRPELVASDFDVIWGNWDPATRTFTEFEDTDGDFVDDNGLETNAARVVIADPDHGHLFGPIFGNDDATISTTAVSRKRTMTIDFEDGYDEGDPVYKLCVPGSGDADCPGGASGEANGTVTLTTYNKPGGCSSIDFFDQSRDTCSNRTFTERIIGGETGAMIFDGTCQPGGQPQHCSGGDDDLWFPDQGNLLINSTDGDESDPNDHAGGAFFLFDFTGLEGGNVTVEDLVVLDTDEGEFCATVRLYDASQGFIVQGDVCNVGNGNLGSLFPDGVEGAVYMTVYLPGSGAIDNVGASSFVDLAE